MDPLPWMPLDPVWIPVGVDSDDPPQLRIWIQYLNCTLEARTQIQIRHPNIYIYTYIIVSESQIWFLDAEADPDRIQLGSKI